MSTKVIQGVMLNKSSRTKRGAKKLSVSLSSGPSSTYGYWDA